jgi:hypothetical protein
MQYFLLSILHVLAYLAIIGTKLVLTPGRKIWLHQHVVTADTDHVAKQAIDNGVDGTLILHKA